MPNCTICHFDTEIEPIPIMGDAIQVECRRCGIYHITETANRTAEAAHQGDTRNMSLLSHAIRKIESGGQVPLINSDQITSILANICPSFFEGDH